MSHQLPGATRDEDVLVTSLLGLVRETCRELHRGAAAPRVTLDSSLERHLGLDSLARVELLARVERTFGVALPDDTLQRAETPRDLLRALQAVDARAGLAPSMEARAEPAAPAESDDGVPVDAATLVEVLDWHLRRHPDRTQVIALSDAGETAISYGALAAGAEEIASGLRGAGLEPRETVAIMLPTSPDYFYVYYGVLLAGGVPVPIYPPARLAQIEDHVRRHAGILANAQAAVLVTVAEAMPVARLLQTHAPTVRRVTTPAELAAGHGDTGRVAASADDIAFIQYTSGSTGNPKGVVLTHANLLANIRAMVQAAQATPRDVFVSWLPLYHDMGLIGAWLATLYLGCPLVVMSPLAFLSRPERWLWAIHRYRATLSAGPNFAYELCVKRLDDSALAGLDLSSCRILFNGAEAVSPDTVARFRKRFARYGLRADAIVPVYGLAESSVGLLFPPLGRAPLIDRVTRQPFMRGRRAMPAAPDDPNPLRFVACGRPLAGHEVRIVDETGREVGERVEGRLEFKGPSATRGYYRNAEESRRLFRGEWLDTGDRAYMAEGEVYVTGRVKDIIIRGGRNLYPHEIEEAVGVVPGVRKGCVAAFGSPDPASGTERLVVLAETRESAADARAALREAVSAAVVDVIGEPPDEVVLAAPHAVLKTSSGKIRRSACRTLYESGSADVGARAPWWQVVRLIAHAAFPQARRLLVLAGELLYATYAWCVFWLIAPLTWAVTALLPKPTWAWAVGRAAARLALRLCGIPLVVRGHENLRADRPMVLVANHASYLDGMILVAALGTPFSFVAKRELRDQLVPGVYLRRLGAQFVERFAVHQSAEDAKRLADAATRGASLAFFPEGTFRRGAGLLPFHLGAFLTAATASVPILPVAIRGSRALLRAGKWLPRRGPVVVTIGAPIAPPAAALSRFAAAAELRAAARAAILRECGEPELLGAESGAPPELDPRARAPAPAGAARSAR